MSTTIDTVRTDAESPDVDAEPAAEPRTEPCEGDRANGAETPPAAWLVGDGPVDVSDVSPARVADYARRADGTVHFERKGGRTYLVAP
jgi:hypothetical protein